MIMQAKEKVIPIELDVNLEILSAMVCRQVFLSFYILKPV